METKVTDPLDTVISDEVLRERVRRIVREGEGPQEKPWKRVLSHPLTAVVVGFLLSGVVGLVLNWAFNENAKERERIYSAQVADAERKLTESRVFYESSLGAIQDFSRAVYARHTRAMMLVSALKRGVSSEEIKERKRLYDDAFVNWGINQQANLLAIRRLTKSAGFSSFEADVEFKLVPVLRTLDSCLTRAYDENVRGGNSVVILDECRAGDLLQQALDQGYAVTSGLYEHITGEMLRETKSPNPGVAPDGQDRR